MSTRSDHLIIRDYITAQDHLQYTQLPEGVVAVLITHSNLEAKHVDIRLDLHNTIQDVKEKLRKHVGTLPEYQKLILKDKGQQICEMWDNTKMLGFYSVKSGMEIHIIDLDPFSLSRGGGLTDVSLIQKYKMSDEKYDERSGTMRAYIKEQRQKDPNFKLQPSKSPQTNKPPSDDNTPPPGVESVAHIKVNDRCQVKPGKRRGTVKFIGELENMSAGGYWVGVCFDEPVGKSDGYVKGIKIFECGPKYGGFIRGMNIQVGHYPVRDLMDDDDEDDEEEEDGDENESSNNIACKTNHDTSNTNCCTNDDEDEI